MEPNAIEHPVLIGHVCTPLGIKETLGKNTVRKIRVTAIANESAFLPTTNSTPNSETELVS